MTDPGERILQSCENVPAQARDILRMYGRALQLGAQIGVVGALLIIGAFIPSPTADTRHESRYARKSIRTQGQKGTR